VEGGAQKERLEAFCKAQWDDDWKLHKVYRDTESGTHMNRPGLEEMLYDAEAKAFNTLLVFRVDRLSRKVRELAQMVDELTKNGVTLKSITEPFDTSNAAGKMMLQMLGVFAELEHATIVERKKVGTSGRLAFFIQLCIILVATAVIPGRAPTRLGTGTGIAGLARGGTLSLLCFFLWMMSSP
jgi:hypothetical protein